MDKQLIDMIHESIPKINDDIAGGLAYRQMQHPEVYVDRAIRIAERDFPPEVRYVGYQVCTPKEEFQESTRRGTGTTIELARRDFFMVKFKFVFHDGTKDLELPPWCLFLPIVGDGGTMYINGSLYQISPVAVDVGLSVGQDEIFLKVNSNRLKFHRTNCEFMRDGEQVSTYAVWCRAHNKSAKPAGNRVTVRANPTLAHYLFAKFGVTETFKRLTNTDVRIGDELTINEKTCPPDKWMICQSAYHLTRGIKPRGVIDKYWVPSKIRLAIPRKRYSLATEGLIAGFFYVLDLFPQRFEASEDYIENTDLWSVLLGIIYWGEGESEGKHLADITAHIEFLDKEIDNITQANLAMTNVHIDDMWKLFIHLIETYSTRVAHSLTQLSSMYGKRLTTIDYVMQDILFHINRFKFSLQQHAGKRKPTSHRDVMNQMNHHLKHNLINGITGGRRRHPEVNSIAFSGDNKFFKGTSILMLQQTSGGNNNSSAPTDGDPSKYLHVSIAEVGSCFTMSHSDPTGRNRINAFCKTERDTIIRNPNFIELLDPVQSQLDR